MDTNLIPSPDFFATEEDYDRRLAELLAELLARLRGDKTSLMATSVACGWLDAYLVQQKDKDVCQVMAHVFTLCIARSESLPIFDWIESLVPGFDQYWAEYCQDDVRKSLQE